MSSPTPLRPTAGAGGASSYSSSSLHHRRRGRPGAGLRRPRVGRCKMKLMYFLMDRDEQREKRLELEFEVSELETVLDKEQRLGRVLQCSLQGRVVCHCCLSTLVPTNVRGLLGELAMVEDEIFYLEKKVEDLRLRLRREQKWTDQCIQQQQQQQSWPQSRQPRHSVSRRELQGAQQLPKLPCPGGDEALECESKASVGSASAKGDEVEHARRSSHCRSSETTPAPSERKVCLNSPNKLSEELIRLMVAIFHRLNKAADAAGELELSGTSKLNISCIGPRSLVPRVAVSGAAAMSPLKNRRTAAKAAGRGAEKEAAAAGCQRRFVEFTRASVDVSRISLCLVDIKNLRGLMQKLGTADPSLLTNKQKLAFWINIYNFCVMHVLARNSSGMVSGVSSARFTPIPREASGAAESETDIVQASVNVGGTVLNVVSIEHLILRHSPEGKEGIMDEGQRDLLRTYGLGYPEPNVVFALCRGSRSSPALRVYTAEDVSNELERAKVEYLESTVRVAGRRQRAAVVVPKLLHWHMRDFADDAASLLEWVHSQLPRASGPLRRAIREVLGASSGRGAATPAPAAKVVEVEPYDAEFCYLLPVW
ncbi:uncharacterized protein C2845_PM07G01540 [Panicum miliaceum]|uniref:DUF547 domain-containing protein n=1 Tax=Panicum miliaceum TaxID=4540 RepID=A0A3L6SIY6_PANMI|nr:uncharacterized protein C2845_PM07G01540 [Panicum miliaceum]